MKMLRSQSTNPIMKDTPMPQSRTTIMRMWVALTIVIFLAACSSDGGSSGGGETEPPEALDVTTTIALGDRPTYLNDDVFMTPKSFVENESVVIDIEATPQDGDASIERVTVAPGDVVNFAGWEVHVERIGADSIRWWAAGPDGEQIGGEPVS